MDFFSIDVETANPDFSSICQIGLVEFRNGSINDQWKSLVNPEVFFDPVNISIHGIDDIHVQEAPLFPDVYSELENRLRESIVICHTHFDRVAFSQAAEKYDLNMPSWDWLDSAKVARSTWSEFSTRGYGLKNLASHFGIEFRHHDALEDARAAGEIMLKALEESNLSIEEWVKQAGQSARNLASNKSSFSNQYPTNRSFEGNPDGPLYGEVIVFTGALTIPRDEAAQLASSAGCEVATTVKKSTTILVVGDQDITKLAGYKKSSKHRKAEKMAREGYQIQIVRESDFKKIIDVDY